MTVHVLLQTALLLLGLLFLVPGRLSQGCPGTVGTYAKMPSCLGQMPVHPLTPLGRHRLADTA